MREEDEEDDKPPVDENVNPHSPKRPRPSLDSGYGPGERSSATLKGGELVEAEEEVEEEPEGGFCIPDSEEEVEEMLGQRSSGAARGSSSSSRSREKMVAQAVEKERARSSGAASRSGSAPSEVSRRSALQLRHQADHLLPLQAHHRVPRSIAAGHHRA